MMLDGTVVLTYVLFRFASKITEILTKKTMGHYQRPALLLSRRPKTFS